VDGPRGTRRSRRRIGDEVAPAARNRLKIFAALFLAASMVVVHAPAASAMTITEFQLIGSSDPEPITAGPDGNMWFTSHFPDRIDRISPSGVITQYQVPSPFEQPYNITAGPDGGVWFAAVGGALSTASAGIGRIDPVSGAITEFPQPAGSRPYGITTGPDGNLWTTDLSSHRISLTTTSGTTTVFPSTTYNRPLNIIAGPDGALWFTEDGMVEGGGGAIGRMTTSGSLSEYLLPTPLGDYSGAGRITVGSDGNLWFTWASWDPSQPLSATSASIGRITPTGTITEFPVSSANGWPPGGITSGPDGDLWFTENGANAIGRISTTGIVSADPVPTPNSGPQDIARGPDGNLWFTEALSSKIGRISLAPLVPPAPTISSIAPLAGQVGTSVTIVGSSLIGTTSVTFNGVTQPSFTVDGIGSVIMAAVPPGASTGPIRVTTPYGTATSPSSFAVVAPGAHVRNVTLSLRRHLVARGHVVVTDRFTACSQGMNVTIQRHGVHRWRTIASALTDATGSFTARLPDRTGWYRARVNEVTLGSGDLCDRAISGTRYHRAKS
jgi:streptogramin lyase